MVPQTKTSSKNRHIIAKILGLLLIFGLGGWIGLHYANKPTAAVSNPTATITKVATTKNRNQVAAKQPIACQQNTGGGKLVLVSISQRHLWACNDSSVLYDSAVITGQEKLAADLTPVGTYHVYGKYINTVLKGSDSTGSWNDPVHYWMPWLHNQYGSYGFHDATWRQPDEFGNISPDSDQASHGCVELPLATANWLYDWAVIGTTVTIQA